MKRYFVNAFVLTLLMGMIGISQERQAKPVTKASIARSLLTLSDKADKAGLRTEATICLKAASEVMTVK